MIIYGSRNIQLAKEIIIDKCPHCGAQHSVEMYVFQKYAHVFWIPFFPMGKSAISQCEQCKQVLKGNEMPEPLKSDYETLKAQTKTPVWTFAGLALVAIFISMGVYSDNKQDEKNAQLIAAPKSGDVFEIKTADNQYTLYKVDHVNGDTAFLRMHQFETNQSSGIAELKQKGDTAFSEENLPFLNAELKEMLKKGEIQNVVRNE